MSLEVIKASINQANIIAEIGAKSFYDTFLEHDGKENVDKYVSENFNTKKIEDEFSEKNVVFFIAVYQNKPVGFLKLRTEEIPEELINTNHIELQRIYLLKEFQGIKAGKALMTEAISFAKNKGFEILWLGVSDKNVKALKFYESIGFKTFGKHIFYFGEEEQEDLLMKKDLTY